MRLDLSRAVAAGVRNGFLALVLLFSSAPIVLVIVNSFNASAVNLWPPRALTLSWYAKLFDHAAFQAGLVHSLGVASLSTLLTLVLATPLAFVLARVRWRGRKLFEAAVKSPLVVPKVVIGFAAFILLITLKLPATGSWQVVVLVHAILSLPIATTVLVAGIAHVDDSLAEAARDLGASRFDAFRLAVLPQMRSSIAVAAVFSFVMSFDEVETTVFLSSSSFKTLPIEMYHYLEYQQDPLIAAASGVLILCTLVIVAAAQVLGRVRLNAR